MPIKVNDKVEFLNHNTGTWQSGVVVKIVTRYDQCIVLADNGMEYIVKMYDLRLPTK